MIPQHCLNCDSSLATNDKYCSRCGQNTHQHRLNLAHLGHEAIHFLTHADKGIFFLIKELASSPGKVAREYIAGRRKKYFSPLNFFLVAVGISVLSLTTLSPMDRALAEQNSSLESLRKLPETDPKRKSIVYIEREMQANHFMSKYANVVNMIFTPLMALVFYFFYFRGRYNYTEHLVTNLYAAGFNALIFSVIISPVMLFLTKKSGLYFSIIYSFLLWELTYRAVMYYGLMNQKKVRSFWFAMLASFVVAVIWLMLSAGLIGYYIRTGFH